MESLKKSVQLLYIYFLVLNVSQLSSCRSSVFFIYIYIIPSFQADVIVNSTSNGLDLQNGAVSSSILKAAGMGLQSECKTKYPGGIQTGGIARTMGHGLNCTEVFHLALSNFSNPSAQQVRYRYICA